MLDTIQNGDIVLVWKTWDFQNQYEINQVILFQKALDKESISFVKRIVAVPNDSIRANSKELIINGKAYPHDQVYFTLSDRMKTKNVEYFNFLAEQSIDHEKLSYRKINTWFDNENLIVPTDYYFLIGDNPYESMDSRFWGFVHEEQIIGKVIVIF